MSLNFSRCRLPPFQHQREDTEWVVKHPYTFIASEMRTGKTKIIIDAAQFLYDAGIINKVIVLTPAPVRDVWADETLGEIAKHAWCDVPNKVVEYHSRVRVWSNQSAHTTTNAHNSLHWYISNFEFLRSRARLQQLLPACGLKTWLVLDESSFVKNYAAQQTKTCVQLRRLCGRVTLLNGTPLFHSPLDLFSQGNLVSERILECKYVTHFKARYALQKPVLGLGGKPIDNGHGKPVLKIDGWTNLEDLERRFAPYTVRRLQAECLDLPPKLDPVTLTATLEDATWRAYKSMRDELIVWLKSGEIVTSASAAIKTLRLSQITGGFLSGVEPTGITVDPDLFNQICTCTMNGLDTCLVHGGRDGQPGFYTGAEVVPIDRRTNSSHESVVGETECSIGTDSSSAGTTTDQNGPSTAQRHVEIGREKLDVLLWFIDERLKADPNLHLVAWSRFRAEVFRAEKEVRERFPQFQTAVILGDQKKSERLHALSLLKPETSPTGPVFVAGIEGTGSFGLDMTAAHTCVSMSTGYSPGRTLQTLDRVYGPGQKHPIAYYNIMAVGPRGQKTIDHDILTTRLTGENIAQRTAAAWVKALTKD